MSAPTGWSPSFHPAEWELLWDLYGPEPTGLVAVRTGIPTVRVRVARVLARAELVDYEIDHDWVLLRPNEDGRRAFGLACRAGLLPNRGVL